VEPQGACLLRMKWIGELMFVCVQHAFSSTLHAMPD
jgi:hypothetical protein